MSSFAPSYFAIERDAADNTKMQIVLGNEHQEFVLRIRGTDLFDRRKREMVNAWALGIYTCPYANVSHKTVQELLDYLEREFPLERMLFPRPKIRLW